MRWLLEHPIEAAKENISLLLAGSEAPAGTPRTRHPALLCHLAADVSQAAMVSDPVGFVVGDTASRVFEREDVRLMDPRMTQPGTDPANRIRLLWKISWIVPEPGVEFSPSNHEKRMRLGTTSIQDVVLNSKHCPDSSHTVRAVLGTNFRNHLCLFASPYTTTFRGWLASSVSL